MCFLLKPCWLTYPCRSGSDTVPQLWVRSRSTTPKALVITTISSLGSFSSLITLPRMTSERPLEYIYQICKKNGDIQKLNLRWQYQMCWYQHHICRWQWWSGIEKHWRIATHAALICLTASASSKTQPAQSEVPYDIQPRMIFETFKPELPKRTGWSHLWFRDDNSFWEGLTVGHFLSRVCHHESLEQVWWYSESANPIYNRQDLFRQWMRRISHRFGFENSILSSLLFRPLLKMSMHMVVYHILMTHIDRHKAPTRRTGLCRLVIHQSWDKCKFKFQFNSPTKYQYVWIMWRACPPSHLMTNCIKFSTHRGLSSILGGWRLRLYV